MGLSTSFLVIQAQRDLAQAKVNELSAVLAYDLALVDFEALQEAGPAGVVGAIASAVDTCGRRPQRAQTAAPPQHCTPSGHRRDYPASRL